MEGNGYSKTATWITKAAAIVLSVGTLWGATVWALKSTFQTKEDAAAAVVERLMEHNESVVAHEKLLNFWSKQIAADVAAEVRRELNRDRRRSALHNPPGSEDVEIMAASDDGTATR